jgi:hypothetical protein
MKGIGGKVREMDTGQKRRNDKRKQDWHRAEQSREK